MQTRFRQPTKRPHEQRGAIAIIVALSAAALLGMFALAVNSGMLYVSRAELQEAADACALAAARELTCDSRATAAGPNGCPSSYLANALAAGKKVAGLSKSGMQVNAVTIADDDVTFSIDSDTDAFKNVAGGASNAARYAKCTARADGSTWLVKAFNLTTADAIPVVAEATATLKPSSNFCSAAPLALCNPTAGKTLTVGQWIYAARVASSPTRDDEGEGGHGSGTESGRNDDDEDSHGFDHSNPGSVSTTGFTWIDYPPIPGTQTPQLGGITQTCGVSVGSNVNILDASANLTDAKMAYSTRFGIYQNLAVTVATSPPDRTGYAYPNKDGATNYYYRDNNPGFAINAYKDYVTRRGTSAVDPQAFNGPTGSNTYIGGKVPSSVSLTTAANHRTFGAERRLVAIPIVDCPTTNAAATKPILDMACVMMVNPIPISTTGTGNGGGRSHNDHDDDHGRGHGDESSDGSGRTYLEYRGLASESMSPCRSTGKANPAGKGPLVPTLVR